MKEKAKQLAQKIDSYDKIHVVSHIDADGITSASIAYKALERADKDVEVKFVKQLDEREIDELDSYENGLIW
ncbi:MAG: recombinase RecJ, partial [Candidatus Thermoplasmatota archaeon]